MRLNRFPIAKSGLDSASWNFHRVVIDNLPVLDSDPKKLEWLGGHATYMMSQRERSILEGSAQKDAAIDDLVDVKSSLHLILTTCAGVYRPQRSVFALREQGSNDIKALIFVASLRLDLQAHTVVADAFVLTMDQDYLKTIAKSLSDLSPAIFGVDISPREAEVWQHILPSMAERCRKWNHGEECTNQQGNNNISPGPTGYSICRCGRGQDITTFKEKGEWDAFAPYVTRIAISPLFAVSYLDPI